MDKMNKLILGDNLEVLRHMPSESVDLIYLDPPFFSNRHYECIWGDKGEIRSFEDRWSGGIEHYIAWLKERVQEMHRILKPTGSLYLHCDYHANAYIRTLILDKIFGPENFRNEIVWCYRRWTAGKHSFQRMHDTIYFYSKTKDYKFNQLKEDFSEKTIVAQFKRKIENGKVIQDKDTPMTRDPEDGIAMKDWWELSYLHPISKERCGYPTQKPEALLQRIIAASSNEGDIVLDPFVGGGTTIAVANKMGRNWIGIDQSATAIRVSAERLDKIEAIYANLTDPTLNV